MAQQPRREPDSPARPEPGLLIRAAAPVELAEVGRLRLNAYRAAGFLRPPSQYAGALEALGAAGEADVLVAAAGSQILGTIAFQSWPQPCEIAVGPDELEVRALAVAPDGQGRGIGRALLAAVIDQAGQRGFRQVVLCTRLEMQTARHLYHQAGFRRLPDRDWSPVAGILLVTYGLRLPAHAPGPRLLD